MVVMFSWNRWVAALLYGFPEYAIACHSFLVAWPYVRSFLCMSQLLRARAGRPAWGGNKSAGLSFPAV